MQLEEMRSLLNESLVETIRTLGFNAGVIIPTKIVVDFEKFIRFVIKDKKEICIIANKEKVDKLSSVIKSYNIPYYLLIDDSLSDHIVMLYK